MFFFFFLCSFSHFLQELWNNIKFKQIFRIRQCFCSYSAVRFLFKANLKEALLSRGRKDSRLFFKQCVVKLALCLSCYGYWSISRFKGMQDKLRKNSFLGILNMWQHMSQRVSEPQIVGSWKSIWENITVLTLLWHLLLVTTWWIRWIFVLTPLQSSLLAWKPGSDEVFLCIEIPWKYKYGF